MEGHRRSPVQHTFFFHRTGETECQPHQGQHVPESDARVRGQEQKVEEEGGGYDLRLQSLSSKGRGSKFKPRYVEEGMSLLYAIGRPLLNPVVHSLALCVVVCVCV